MIWTSLSIFLKMKRKIPKQSSKIFSRKLIFGLYSKPIVSWFALFAICTISFSLIQDDIRPQYAGTHSGLIYLLGVLPNFFPAVGLPALFMILLPYFASGDPLPK